MRDILTPMQVKWFWLVELVVKRQVLMDGTGRGCDSAGLAVKAPAITCSDTHLLSRCIPTLSQEAGNVVVLTLRKMTKRGSPKLGGGGQKMRSVRLELTTFGLL